MRKWNDHPLYRMVLSVLNDFSDMKIPLCASHASFFLCLSAFPALLLFVSLLRYTNLQAGDLTGMLVGLVPSALMPYVDRVITGTYDAASGAMVGFSAILALWSASRGITGLLYGMNRVYHVTETRNILHIKLISVLYTFLFLIVMLLTLVLHVFGTVLLNLLAAVHNPVVRFAVNVIDLRFFLLLFFQTVLFSAVFMVFPNKRNKLRDSIPGALLASIGWLVFSDLFSIYVEHFPKYANIYGSVYAAALGMLWLYACISIVFYGGALNYFLMKSGKDR